MFPALSFQDLEFASDVLADRVARTAGALNRAGIRNGDSFALMLRNGPTLIELMLAARQTGAYFVPLNWHFKGEETGYILRDSGARLLIIGAEFYPAIRENFPADISVYIVGRHGEVHTRDWDDAVAGAVPYSGNSERITAAIAYTSGTSGRPKGVRRAIPVATGPAGSIESMTRMWTAAFGVGSDSRCLISAPLYHTAPCSYVMHAARSGAWLRVESHFDPEATLAAVERYRISHLYLVPTMFVRLLRLPEQVRRRYDLASVRFVISTGAPCAPEIKREMTQWWGDVIYESYAASELGYVTVISSAEARHKPGSAGRPLDGVSIRILNEELRDVAPGTIGTIYVRQTLSPDFTYINRQSDRAALQHDDFVTIGDIGYLDRDGYLYVTDRRNDLVISGGVNIYPAEIEMHLIAMPGVADCAVFGVPDPEFGQSLVAVIQPIGDVVLDYASVREFLASRLAKLKIPAVIEFRNSLPREETGKIFKRRLREEYTTHRTTS
jgi:long-chain acyl-CoA synthetase